MILFGINGASSNRLINSVGGVNEINSIEKFRDDLKILLETKKGTQIGDPSFGSNLYSLLYEPANEVTASMIRQEVARTIEAKYTNVNILSVDVKFKAVTVELAITYNIVNTNISDTTVLEFVTAE